MMKPGNSCTPFKKWFIFEDHSPSSEENLTPNTILPLNLVTMPPPSKCLISSSKAYSLKKVNFTLIASTQVPITRSDSSLRHKRRAHWAQFYEKVPPPAKKTSSSYLEISPSEKYLFCPCSKIKIRLSNLLRISTFLQAIINYFIIACLDFVF